MPEHYRGSDAIGLFKTGSEKTITIALSTRIAGAVESRRWQEGQIFERFPDGSARITFRVYDLSEAVRWTLSFAPEAHVIAPPEAVAIELRLIDALASSNARRARPRSA